MQQLTLQFEGYADSWRTIDAGTARQCSTRKTWLESRNGVASGVAGEDITNLTVIEGTVAVAASFALVFLAVIIGG